MVKQSSLTGIRDKDMFVMNPTNKSFKIICGSLLMGIAFASAYRLAFPQAPTITDAQAQTQHYKDAQEYQQFVKWMHSLHQWHLTNDQLAEARTMFATGSPTVRMNVISHVTVHARHKPYDQRGIVFLGSCTHDPDRNVRSLLSMNLATFHDPTARAALQAMSQDTDPAIHKFVAQATSASSSTH